MQSSETKSNGGGCSGETPGDESMLYHGLKEKYSKLEATRNALRQGVKIQNELIDKLQNENLNLKKAYEEERVKVDTERHEKAKELAIRVSLENEICALKTEILSLQQRGGSQADVDGEVILLRKRLSEEETEINRLKELVEKERMKTESDSKKVEAEKQANKAWKIVEAEKSRADEERRLADIERKKMEENRIQLEKLKSEAEEARSKLIAEAFKSEEANKKVKAERQKASKEKKRADSEMAKAEEQRKLAEINQKKAMDEKCRANNLSQQLEEHRQRIEKLQKEMFELVSSRKLAEAAAYPSDKQVKAGTAKLQDGLPLQKLKQETGESKLFLEGLRSENLNKRLEEGKQKVIREKMRADSEMRKAEEQRKFAEANKKKAMEEKHRADQFARELEDNRCRIEELQKEILELTSSRTLEASVVLPDVNMDSETAKIKLLKKQLKFKKKQVKHAKEVAKLEIGRNKILQRELHCLKQEFVQFSHRVDVLNNCFSHSSDGRDDLAKTGSILNASSLNLKRELFNKETHQVHLHCNNELVWPSCTTMDASDCIKQTMECTAPLLPFSGGNCTQCISGINSKMEPLLRCSNRKMLQSSVINSSTASFSDRPLMGSQERGAFSVTASSKLAEDKTNSQPNISSLSGEVTKMRYNENLAVVAENSVRCPISIDAVGRKAGHSKKRKSILDAIKSIELIHSEGKKWHLQIEEKLSMLHGMLNSQIDKSLQEDRCMLPNMDCDPDAELARAHKKRKASPGEEAALQHLCDSNDEQKDRLETRGVEEANVCTQAFPPINDPRGTVQVCIDGMGDSGRSRQEKLGSYEEMMEVDYIKLLDLDNAVDEECYRRAIQMPLSPTLPVIEFQNSETFEIDNPECLVDESSHGGFSKEMDNQVPSCLEIDSNKLKFSTSETSHVPLLRKNEGSTDTFENLANNESGKCNTVFEDTCDRHAWDSFAELGMSDLDGSGYKAKNISCQSAIGSACDDIPRYYVVFSDTKDPSSVSRICHATGTCMAQCSMISRTDWVVQKILPALLKIEGLSPKEKACVFFSVLLHNFSGIALENFGNFLNRDSIVLLDSFAGHIHTVMADVESRSVLAELCLFGELLTLIEDFLVDRRILVYSNVSSESFPISGSRVDIHLNGADINLLYKIAPTHQLVAGGILLASICAAIDHVGFLCEASFNIFRMHKLDTSLVLTILHVFAHVCGSKYFNLKDYSLIMTVLKSLVTIFEEANLSSDSTSRLPSMSEAWSEFPSCTKCPFSVGAVSVDVVVSLLWEKLQNCVLSSTMHQDRIESVNSSNSEALSSNKKTEKILGHEGAFHVLSKFGMPTTELHSVCDGSFCHFSDVLSLMELVACSMSWDWICNNIICHLWKLLESCVLENFFAVIVILLGKLGRLGVDASGYEDNSVENLRCCLSAFLCQNSSRKLGFSTQIAIVNALLGLISLDFEELINTSMELPAVVSRPNPADFIRKWYYDLSNEQQSLSFSLLQSASLWRCRTG